MWAFLIAVVVLIVALVVGLSSAGEDEAPPAADDALWDGSWYDDGLGRIDSDRALVKGMKAFEKETGARPYLTLLGDIEPEKLDSFVQEQYEALFSDGDHLLVVYDEWEENTYYLSARTGEGSALSAADVSRVLSCIEKAYADPANVSYAAAFGAGFAQGARELAVSSPTRGVGLLVALGCLLIVLSVVLVLFLRKRARISNGWDDRYMEEDG